MEADRAAAIAAQMEADHAAREAERDLGHDYDGIEPGTLEHDETQAEYLAEAEAGLELEL